MRPIRPALSLLVAALSFAPPATAQTHWEREYPAARYGATAAFDSARGEFVMTGGSTAVGTVDETWEWNGQQWQARIVAGSLESRAFAASTFDPVRGVTVLFGGRGPNGLLGDTWLHDGVRWTRRRNTAPAPSPRESHAMVFDVASGSVLLFGGSTGPGQWSDETWAFDGSAWTQLNPASAPSARAAHAMAGGNAGVILFGGNGPSGRNAETWSWDGTNWQLVTITGGRLPEVREGHAMAFDAARGEVLLFGGIGRGNARLDDTWALNGTVWQNANPTGLRPSPRERMTLAFDPGTSRTIMVGGRSPLGALLDDLWEWDGNGWTPRVLRPDSRVNTAMAYSPAAMGIVLFGGSSGGGETWIWANDAWMPATPALSPSARQAHGMASVGASNVLLFGGRRATGALSNETWTFDGTSWALRSPATRPSPRESASMCRLHNGNVLMFGGRQAAGNLSDTWLWDDAQGNWTSVVTSDAPSPRRDAAMTFDPIRDQVVLFGGFDTALNDETWTFDPATASWTQRIPMTNPTPRAAAGMAFDQSRGVATMVGGDIGNGTNSGEVWEWDGSDWRWQRPVCGPTPRRGAAIAFDPTAMETVVFGGEDGGLRNDTFTALSPMPARVRAFGSSCAGSGVGPVLRAAPGSLPWVNSRMSFETTLDQHFPFVISVIGFDNTTWNGQPLPVNLTPFGFPGCMVYTAPLNYRTSFALNSFATFDVVVPKELREFTGFDFYVQSFVIGTAAFPRREASNALACTIGLR